MQAQTELDTRMTDMNHTMTRDKSGTSDAQESNPEAVRLAAKLSLDDMANLMGMSLNGYSLWEKGARSPGGPAHRLLQLIENDAEAVKAVLK